MNEALARRLEFLMFVNSFALLHAIREGKLGIPEADRAIIRAAAIWEENIPSPAIDAAVEYAEWALNGLTKPDWVGEAGLK
jgi:hypothetical protein